MVLNANPFRRFFVEISNFSEWIVKDLRNSGLTDETIEEMGIEEIKGMENLKSILGFASMDKQSLLQTTECYRIPYPCPE